MAGSMDLKTVAHIFGVFYVYWHVKKLSCTKHKMPRQTRIGKSSERYDIALFISLVPIVLS